MSNLVYWVTNQKNTSHSQKAQILKELGYLVSFLSPDQELSDTILEKKSSVIIFTDNAATITPSIWKTMVNDPALNGMKMILSVETGKNTTISQAYYRNFRDMIPLDLDHHQWRERLQFATSQKKILIAPTLPKISIAEKSVFSLPVAFIWIGKNQFNIETNINPPTGSIIDLQGSISKWFSLNQVHAKIIRSKETQLTTRFRFSLTCSWLLDPNLIPRLNLLLEKLQTQATESLCKVYAVCTSLKLKKKLKTLLDKPGLKTYFPQNVRSWINEPSYIVPDFILIEDTLMKEENQFIFDRILPQLKDHQQVLIIGHDFDRQILKKITKPKNISSLKKIPESFANALEKRKQNRIGIKNVETHYFLDRDQPLSQAEIQFSSILSHVDQFGSQVHLPYPVALYSLCTVRSDFFRQAIKTPIWAKIINATPSLQSKDIEYPFQVECIFSNNLMRNRRRIGRFMMQHLEKNLLVANCETISIDVPKFSQVPTAIETVFEDVGDDTTMAPHDSSRMAQKMARKKRLTQNTANVLADLGRLAFLISLIFVVSYFLYYFSENFDNSEKIFSKKFETLKRP